MKFKPVVERRTAKIVTVGPRTSETVVVYANSFGFITPKSEKNFVSIGGLSCCVGARLRSSSTGLQVGVHLDVVVDSFTLTWGVLSHLAQMRLVQDQKFDVAELVVSLFGHKPTMRKIFYALKLAGMDPKITRYRFVFGNSHIFDKEGKITIAKGLIPDVPLLTQRENLHRHTERQLVLENTRKPVDLWELPMFEIAPGVPSLVMRKDRRLKYAVNLVIPEGQTPQDPQTIPRFADYVKVALRNYNSTQFYCVSTEYPTSLTARFAVQETAFLLAHSLGYL